MGHLRVERARAGCPRLPDRGRVRRDPAQHHRRAGSRPAARAPCRQGRAVLHTGARGRPRGLTRARAGYSTPMIPWKRLCAAGLASTLAFGGLAACSDEDGDGDVDVDVPEVTAPDVDVSAPDLTA